MGVQLDTLRDPDSPLSQLNETVVIEDDHRETVVPNVHHTSVVGSILARCKEVSSPHAESSKANSKGGPLVQTGISCIQQHDDSAREMNTPKDATVNVSRNALPIASPKQVKIVESSLSKENHVTVQVAVPLDNPLITLQKCAITRTEKEEMLQYSRKDDEQCDAATLVH
ncbi:hypothetical protein V6N13_047983 [Hibiscus sabdariffa]|uniref:Uncharacterized protein n=1 Tax=Hibiscus sabdariffa TaxID=183260 RepID=A0ABR2F5T7_9ROSI